MERKRKRLRPKISNQLCNYPLARDTRTRLHWYRSESGKWWWCKLPGDDRIEFWLPHDVDKELRHCPTPFDINVLVFVLARVQEQDSGKIEFKSAASMLRTLGLRQDFRSRRQLHWSLRYWRRVRIRYRNCWHRVGYKERISKIVNPPLAMMTKDGRRLHLEVRQEWIDMHQDNYWTKLPIPLPMNAAAQNLVLMLACRIKELFTAAAELPTAARWTKPLPAATYRKKIGLLHGTRGRQFTRLLKEQNSPLNNYYEIGRLSLLAKLDGPYVTFALMPFEPKPRVQLKPVTTTTERVKRIVRKPQPVKTEPEWEPVETRDEEGRSITMWRQSPDGELVPERPS